MCVLILMTVELPVSPGLVFSFCPHPSFPSLLKSCLLQEVLTEHTMCTGDCITWPLLGPGLRLNFNSQLLVAQEIQEGVVWMKPPSPSFPPALNFQHPLLWVSTPFL